jgi:type I restriction enzyme M protein
LKALAWYTSLDSTVRFDAAHYLPELRENLSRLKVVNGKELCHFVHGKTGMTGGSTPLGANYPNHGIRFIRTPDYGPEGIKIDQCVFINEDHDCQNARSQLAANDVLLSITGVNFGESSVVTPECLPANISQHSVRIRHSS